GSAVTRQLECASSLFSVLRERPAAIVLGAAGSGKSSIIKSLAQCLSIPIKMDNQVVIPQFKRLDEREREIDNKQQKEIESKQNMNSDSVKYLKINIQDGYSNITFNDSMDNNQDEDMDGNPLISQWQNVFVHIKEDGVGFTYNVNNSLLTNLLSFNVPRAEVGRRVVLHILNPYALGEEQLFGQIAEREDKRKTDLSSNMQQLSAIGNKEGNIEVRSGSGKIASEKGKEQIISGNSGNG
ncbi:MAG: hypothetical protein EZS28_001679, partial [Streblomastix strix]